MTTHIASCIADPPLWHSLDAGQRGAQPHWRASHDLCAYLRMPYLADAGGAHLQEDIFSSIGRTR